MIKLLNFLFSLFIMLMLIDFILILLLGINGWLALAFGCFSFFTIFTGYYSDTYINIREQENENRYLLAKQEGEKIRAINKTNDTYLKN